MLPNRPALLYDTWPSQAAALVLACSVATALFFHGYNVDLFGLAQVLLIVWLTRIAWQGYEAGIVIPRTGLAIALTLFWAWLGVSLVLSPVPYVSMASTWWIGSLPLVFWMFTLAPDRDRVWKSASVLILVVGLALAVTAAYQLLFRQVSPRSVFLNINSHAALLNLIALPVAGYFFMVRAAKGRWDALSTALAVALFVLVYGVAITKGRAAALTFMLSAGLLLAVAVKRVSRKDVALFLFLVAAAFALADLSWQGGVQERLETLYDMGSAGETRFIIWRQSWEMLKDSPWWGIGLGIYSLAWPPYRDPADASAGYFVHNDYLQIWIELGLPGLALFIAVLISALWVFIRLMRNVAVPPDSKIELTGLFGGLLAVAMHSFLDFNFYIMAILMISGLMLGRIHSIAVSAEGTKSFVLRPSRVLGSKAYRAMVILLAMFPLVYFVSLGLSAYEYDKALALTGKGQLQEAGEALSRAARLSPTSDNVVMSQADLYRHLITALPPEKQKEKTILFDQARELLDRAVQLNPLRAQIYAVRGQLYQENPSLLGEDGSKQAIQAYQQALRLNPRLYPARLRYAKLLYSLERRAEAHRLTEEGMKHWYYETDEIVAYYAFTAKLRFEAGEKERALALANSIERILKDFGWRRVPVPERPMFKTT